MFQINFDLEELVQLAYHGRQTLFESIRFLLNKNETNYF